LTLLNPDYLSLSPYKLFLDLEQLTTVVLLVSGPLPDLLLYCLSFLWRQKELYPALLDTLLIDVDAEPVHPFREEC